MRSFDRRIPLAPTIIALALITLLVLTNLYGPTPGTPRRRDGSAPSPASIPPQLPAQDQSVEAAPGQAGAPDPAGTIPPPSTTPGAAQPLPQATVTVTATVTAPPPAAPSTGGNTPGRTASAQPGTTPSAPATTTTTTGGGGGTTPVPTTGSGGGESPPPPADKRLRVTEVRVNSDRPNGARVRCNGVDEVVFSGTVLVDGGPGDIVYQWVFDGLWTWPIDYLVFTGSGARQQTLSVPWRVPPQIFGKLKGTIQLRVLQPAAYAQTKRLDINFVCS
ncbi:hypothetical protein [Streptomyces sp. SID3343]|uniref:hypothetical protein n=1 Tax=Streptomyces sp. SID3343 TaxID=2690260 RepID=UPI00136D044C|nr:hypothetical protein [Streptomyces sp. SID3343]MYV96841.1 hypothetical protein [Streptomyces sp. SID3343]